MTLTKIGTVTQYFGGPYFADSLLGDGVDDKKLSTLSSRLRPMAIGRSESELFRLLVPTIIPIHKRRRRLVGVEQGLP